VGENTVGENRDSKSVDGADRLLVLRALRLKGRLSPEAAQVFVPGGAGPVLESLVADGLAGPAGSGVKLTGSGRDQLEQWLAAERLTISAPALEATYERFDEPNQRLKSIVTGWQQLPDGSPNLHQDPGYDAGIVERPVAFHADTVPLLEEIAGAVSRLGHYPLRLGSAVQQCGAGDTSFMASPLKDSYHQVWFELHEDLIGLLGRTRIDEAEAGRAL
jgi:hypothetical protein